jgi:hypothetical protein
MCLPKVIVYMACERGQYLQKEFERAVADRISAEPSNGPRLKEAKTVEARILLERTIHISGCPECWIYPPPS